MKVAFYAPLKAPDHPVPSGDRTMARALIKALEWAGHEVAQPCRLRFFLPEPDALRQTCLIAQAQAARDSIAAEWRGSGTPDLWFTYHNYYKAPDLLGPALARHFALPYVVAEASHAAKRAKPWGLWHAQAEAASRAADLHLAFTERDAAGIAPLLAPNVPVLTLPPFIDLAGLDQAFVERADSRTVQLATVAMMRPGDKLASYRCLAEALGAVGDVDWHLDIIGDGPARATVEAAFAPIPATRLTWFGQLDRAPAFDRLKAADLFVWPGFGEAFGMAYLEAQAAGTPVLAFDTAGVSSVLRNLETGLLVDDPTPRAFANALRELVSNRPRLGDMGREARRFVLTERSLAAASCTLDAALQQVKCRSEATHA